MNEPALAWIVVSFLGALPAAVGAVEAFRDLRAMKGYGNGRQLNARRDLRNQLFRTFAQLAWVYIGVRALADGVPGRWTEGVIVLIVVNIGFGILAALDLRDRRALMARVA